MTNKWEQESGYTLIGVLAIFVILTALGMSLVMLSVTSVKTSTTERDDQSAFYIAEAGLNYKMKEIEEDVLSVYELKKVKTKEDFYSKVKEKLLVNDEKVYEKFESDAWAELVVNPLSGTENEYEIISTGYSGNQTRSVAKIITVTWKNKIKDFKLPPFAVFTSGSFNMGSGSITGDIGTVNESKGGIYFGNNGGQHNDGAIYVPRMDKDIVKSNNSNINSEIKAIDETYSIPQLPPFPEIPSNFTKLPDQMIKNGSNTTDLIKDNNLLITNWITNNYTLVMNNDLEFHSITLNENNKLYIDVGDTDKRIVVNNLDIVNGHVELKGKGNLTIYVIDKIIMGAGSTINNNGDVNRLNVYLKGSDASNQPKKIVLSGAQKVYGSLYAEDADITLTAGGGFIGNIFTGGKNFKVDGGSYNQAQLFFAPNANFDMTSGGNEFEGMIIANTFEISGGWQIFYKEFQFSDGPISPAALGINNGNDNDGFNGDETGEGPSLTTTPLREVTKNVK